MKMLLLRTRSLALLFMGVLILLSTDATGQVTRLGNRVNSFEVWGNQKLQWLTGNGKGYTEGMTVPHIMSALTPASHGPWTVDFCLESITSGSWGFIDLAPFNASIDTLSKNNDGTPIVIDDVSGAISAQNATFYAVFGDSLGHHNPNFTTCSPTEHGVTVQFTTIDLTKPIYIYFGGVLSKPGDVSWTGVPITTSNSSSTKNGNWQGAQYSNGNRTTNIQSPEPFVQLPVELTSFNVLRTRAGYLVEWQTASETNNAGFAIEQSSNGGPWHEVGYVPGAGTTSTSSSYSYTINSSEDGLHRFRLRQIDLDGAWNYSSMVEIISELPKTHFLSDAYPNPFNPSTSFSLLVAAEQRVKIDVYDVLGRQVATLFDGRIEANVSRLFNVNGSGLPSGAYTIVVRGLNFVDATNVVLLK